MDAADLRVFQSVASTGSMSKAALELNTVQSNVTARIKSLEDEVGFALFERTNRGVTLTAAGQRLLPFAARAARLLDDARRAVADRERLPAPADRFARYDGRACICRRFLRPMSRPIRRSTCR